MNNYDKTAIRNLQTEVWEHGQAKGWHADEAFRHQVIRALDLVKSADPAAVPRGVQDALLEAEKRTRLAGGVNIGEQLMLIVTEAAEAMEDYRNKHLDPAKPYVQLLDGRVEVYDDNPALRCAVGVKPVGFGSELADVFIRVLHLASRVGIDLAEEVQRKMVYNTTREFRHGGKRA